MKKFKFYFFVCIGLVLFSCDAANNAGSSQSSTSTTENSIRIGFYNVENLFDTKDNPNKPDEEFTPTSEKEWTTERYSKKLDQLGKVIAAMGNPTFLGVCEVENEQVLLDLAANDELKAGNYAVAHRESNDYRGIDNALLYDKSQFTVTNIENIVLSFPPKITEGKPYSSRDLFHVTGQLNDKTELHIFVNHFPSRRGGLKASEPKRTFVAGELRKEVDKVYAANQDAKIIIMGDFNDETDNRSITEVLKAVKTDTDASQELVNCFAAMDAEGKGTYNYRGNWNLLDQIILSDNFYNEQSTWKFSEAVIFREEWMMYNDPRNGATPSRTYGGPNYYGGFSDHLPVYVDIKK